VRAIAELGIAIPTDDKRDLTHPTAPGNRLGLRYRFGASASTGFDLWGSQGTLSIHGEWLEDLSESFRVPNIVSDDDFDVNLDGTPWGGAGTSTLQAPSVVIRGRLGDFSLSLVASHLNRSMPFTGIYSFPDSREARDAYRAELQHRVIIIPEVTLQTRFYADLTTWSERSTFSRLFYCLPEQIDGCRFDRSSTSRSAGVEQMLQIDWTLDGAYATMIGYDVRGRHMSSRSADYSDPVTHDLPIAQRLPYASRVTALGAVFAQQIIRPIEWLTFNLGARLDVDSLFGARLSPRGAVVFTPVDGTTIRASYSEAFRAPTPFELTEIDPTYRLAPESLRPEVVRNVELEWQQRIEWMTFSVRGYAAFYEDLVAFDYVPEEEAQAAIDRGDLVSSADPTSINTRTNLGAYRSFGGTAGIALRPVTGLEIAGSFTYAHNRVVVQDDMGMTREDPVIFLPEWYGNARVSYQFARDGASLAVAALFAASRIPYLQATFYDPATMEYLDLFGPPLGEQLDLRATFLSPIDPIPGLQLRIALGYSINPRVPSLYSDPMTVTPGPTRYYPQVGSTFGFIGLSYTLQP
jgi:outer membrane receptor protein involved in Fe transport